MGALKKDRPATVTADYDRHADVLYIARGRRVPAEGEGLPGGVELDFALADGSPCGATVIGFWRNGWSERLDELASIIGKHLSIDAKRIATAILAVVAEMAMQSIFFLPFEGSDAEIREDIFHLEKNYLQRPVGYAANSEEADAIAGAAGKRIREGERTKENLKMIFHWKHESFRGRYEKILEPLFDSNTSDDVKKALTLAHEAQTKEDAVAALLKLHGVDVLTASAMLANIYPDQFTVMDSLALRALGIINREVAFYLIYNDECHRIAKKYGVSVRSLDRALWEWGKIHPPKRTRRKARSRSR